MTRLEFPKGFVWGTASASYQVEGAVKEDGRGESIWDRYCAIPGNVANGDTGDVACDHYHRFREDIALMKQLGMKGYRFSVSWPRVCPGADGVINEAGLQFYSELVNCLLEADITPYVTLYHWDLPQAMQDIGGWANPEMPRYFLHYAQAVMQRLGDRVRHWITLNEPYCAAFLGNGEGRQAPGLHDFSTALRVAYHMYVGHGEVVKYFRSSWLKGKIGIALNLMGRLPFSDSPQDQAAAMRADGFLNRWFLDPLIRGQYPQDMVALYRNAGVVLPEVTEDAMRLIRQPLDFIGLNYYNDFYVKDAAEKWPTRFVVENPPHMPVNDRSWPITEDGFLHMLLRLKKEYGIQNILITENGTATNEVVDRMGRVDDPQRVDYLARHLHKLHQAIAEGVNVIGYMQWSFCDNFEWSFGYHSRFGLVYIDFKTQKRIVKQSGYWYSRVAQQNCLEWEENGV